MSDSVRPHRRQPTRLRCPWDSPGKNTGVGGHFLLQCRKVKSESEVAQSQPHGLQPTRLLHPRDFPGKQSNSLNSCRICHPMMDHQGLKRSSLWLTGKESACNAGDPGPIPGSGRPTGEGKGYPLQYSGLENLMDYSPWGHSRTRLSNFHFHWKGLWVWFPSVRANTTACTSSCPAVRLSVVSGPKGGFAELDSPRAGTRERQSSHSTQAKNLRGHRKEP